MPRFDASDRDHVGSAAHPVGSPTSTSGPAAPGNAPGHRRACSLSGRSGPWQPRAELPGKSLNIGGGVDRSNIREVIRRVRARASTTDRPARSTGLRPVPAPRSPHPVPDVGTRPTLLGVRTLSSGPPPAPGPTPRSEPSRDRVISSRAARRCCCACPARARPESAPCRCRSVPHKPFSLGRTARHPLGTTGITHGSPRNPLPPASKRCAWSDVGGPAHHVVDHAPILW